MHPKYPSLASRHSVVWCLGTEPWSCAGFSTDGYSALCERTPECHTEATRFTCALKAYDTAQPSRWMTLGRSELNHINVAAHVPNCAPLSLGEDRQDMRLATQCFTVPRIRTHDFLQSGSLRMNHSDTKHQRRHDDQLANEPCFRSPWKKWRDLFIRFGDNINTVSEA